MGFNIERADKPFVVKSPYKPSGDQPQAIAELAERIENGENDVVLMGATGTGKTATTAWLIEKLQRPTLIIEPNKTLAAQLCAEFRELMPDNAVSYFVSYYDYYQPEAYIPQTDTYIEKDSNINDDVERLRHQATANLLTRRDCVVVATVSCIYGLGTPEEYAGRMLFLKVGQEINRDDLLRQFVAMQYKRNDIAFTRGTFRVRGDTVEIIPVYEELAVRIEFFGDEIDRISCLLYTSSRPPIMWPAPNAWNGRSKPFARNSTNAWQNCANKARSWKRSASTCAPPTIWKCSPKLACAQASKTIRATLTAAPLAPRRTRCSTSSLTTSCWSSTNHTSLCRRSVPCTRAMPPASARWSNTASACPPRWTTDRFCLRNSMRGSTRR